MLDHLGHLRIKDNFNQILNTLDLFLFTILTEFEKRKTTIIICSDHGNFEDLSMKMHTRNPALTITAGKFAEELFNSVKSISDIKPSLIKFCR
jgi:bisphosphoglycerate-independent phosphoglycerate mutase (AlkP superfamily)